MEQKLEQLNKLKALFEDGKADAKEVAELFSVLMKAMQKMKADMEEVMNGMDSSMAVKHKELYAEMSQMESEMKTMMEKKDSMTMKECVKMMAKMEEEMEAEMEKIKEDMPSMPDLSDIHSQLKEISDRKIPKIEDIENNLPKLGEKIRDGLELLQDENRLDKSAIKGLDEELLAIRSLPRGGGASRRVFQPYRDNFSSLTDGSTKIFYLSRAPMSEVVFVYGTDFPRIYNPATDFTIANKVLTLTDAVVAPSQGATLLVEYFS